MKELIDKLEEEQNLTRQEFLLLLDNRTKELASYLFERARAVRHGVYGRDIYIRGLIEFTNYCRNDCFYCGIRKSNEKAVRYRLSEEEILECCEIGYGLGFRTFVLQGGEDGWFTVKRLCSCIAAIKKKYPDCAVTLSFGEHSKESYENYFQAGADRYLLRHETADTVHYGKLHPPELSLEKRMDCLWTLKDIGFQTGCGFMVGSPFQTKECLVKDLEFIKQLQPHMVGIGPFLSHHQTPFSHQNNGSIDLTLFMLGLVRLMLPNVLLPATTALGTAEEGGRERGVLAGANVVMPNLSPLNVRNKYLLYDNKISTGDEAAESVEHLRQSMQVIGYKIVECRGDFKHV